MDLYAITILYRMELRSILRVRRVLVFSILLPFLFMPLVLFASGSIKRAQQAAANPRVITLALTGARASWARGVIEDAARRTNTLTINLSEASAGEAEVALKAGRIDGYLEALDGEQAQKALADEGGPREPGGPGEPPVPEAARSAIESGDSEATEAPVLLIYYREDRTASRAARDKIHLLLLDHRRERQEAALLARGLSGSAASAQDAWLKRADVATEEQLSGSRAGRFLTAVILLFMLVGGASIASDSIAGEKERGTLETLLSAGAGRHEVIAAKLLVILTATLVTTFVQIANLFGCMALGLMDASSGFGAGFPWSSAPLLALLFLPLSVLVASVLVLTFGMAKSYKEAQLYFAPLMIVGPVLALAPALPGVALRSAIVLFPLVNISVAVKEVLLHRYDWPMIGLAWIVTAAAAVFIARLAARVLSAERLILSGGGGVDPKDGQGRLSAHVLAWFAALWALVFTLSASGASEDLRANILLGQALFLAATGLLLARYKLRLRDALSLRPVKPIVWLTVLLGAPAAAVVATGLFHVVSRALPVPRGMLEQLGEDLIPKDIPTWQLIVLLALLPAACEELTFRGVLLYGLRRKLRPVALCLVIGAIFGLFHLAIFRLITTAFLGVLLTAVALLTGSIFPGMLWHAINNAFALLVMKAGLPADDPPPWVYAAASLVLVLSMWTLWKSRPMKPHPDAPLPPS